MNGLIAFFDILGYQSFLENNGTSDSARKVLKLITETPSKVKNEIGNYAYGKIEEPEELKEAKKALKHLIFSDTVVLSIEYPPQAGQHWKDAALVHLTGASGMLCANMFVEGLPMRGAIVEGEFYIEDMCFAGQAIVDGYKLCHSLDFAGLVYGSDLHERLPIIYRTEIWNAFFVTYLSPLKGSEEKN